MPTSNNRLVTDTIEEFKGKCQDILTHSCERNSGVHLQQMETTLTQLGASNNC